MTRTAEGQQIIAEERRAKSENPPTDIELCANWLLDRLKSGPQSYTSLKEQLAHEPGFNETTLQRARKHLGDQIVDTIGPRRKGNEWTLAQRDY